MGGWVQRRFRDRLGDRWKVMDDRPSLLALKAAPPSQVIDTPAGVKTSSNDLGDAIVKSTRSTYSEMREEMMKKLKRGLREQEIDYYNLVAAASKKGGSLTAAEKLTAAHVDYAYGKLEAAIGPIMNPKGW